VTTTFTGQTLDALTQALGSRARALAARRWLYACRPGPPTQLPERIPGVAPEPWGRLRARAPLPVWSEAERDLAPDGTIKFALSFAEHVSDARRLPLLADGSRPLPARRPVRVETVLIPTRGRSTVCVSSQVGCTRRCAFCATATLGFARQLEAGEIVLQYALAQAAAPAHAPARNVVFMGMGEPLDNLDAVLEAIAVLTDEGAPRLAAGHVTVSTSGVLPGLRRFLASSRAHLALSLNATTDAQRERLMPHTRTWPIGALLEALRVDAAAGSGRRYFIEYVLWDGENDHDEDARRLVALLAGLPAHVNLIPHNPFPESPLRPAAPARVLAFQQRLTAAGVRALVRQPRGREIAAACGQLALRANSDIVADTPR
jgi:23S rRNA (adenine2503-C2)-methyltransferase